jgi:MoaA/NifB/PqqE/SkfB family radical SAM enzyme
MIDRPATPDVGFLSLHLTDLCQLSCTHCATGSGPDGTHGTMTMPDWFNVIDQAAAARVRMVQMVGGEPMLFPGLAELVRYALGRGLLVEVFSNLVHVPEKVWKVLELPGASLGTAARTVLRWT